MKELRKGNKREREEMTADEEKDGKRREWRLLCGEKKMEGEVKEREAGLRKREKRSWGAPRGHDHRLNVQQMLRVCVRVWVIGCLVAPHGNTSLSAHRISDTSTPGRFPQGPTSLVKHKKTHLHTNTHAAFYRHMLYIRFSVRLKVRFEISKLW